MITKSLKDLIIEYISLKGITLEKLAQATGVQLNFIKALIEEKTDQLPPEVYMRGNLKKIAQYLNIDDEEISQALKRQGAVLKSGDLFPKHRYKFHQKKIIISIITISLALVGVIIYLILNINHGIQFEITEPRVNTLTTSNSIITIKGHAQALDSIFINSNSIPVQQNGEFSTSIELIPGLNIIEIESRKLFGGSVKIKKEVFYQSSENASTTMATTTPQ